MNDQDIEKDLNFLKEIKEKISDGFERKDPTLTKYGMKMIDDWIDELEEV